MSNLEGINFYADYTIDDKITQNVISFFKYGLLEIGAYYNILTGQLDAKGRDVSLLSPLEGNKITPYTVYRGLKTDWVYESNITLKSSGSQPIQPSGITYNGTFVPLTGTVNGGSYYIDYSKGQVVFSNPLNRFDRVQCSHTERGVNIYMGGGTEYRNIANNWRDTPGGSGVNDLSPKAYLPALFIEVANKRTVRGTELGSRHKFMKATLDFDIVSANSYEAKKLSDLVYMMEEKSIRLFDLNRITQPQNYRGELTNPSGFWKYWANDDTILFGLGRFARDYQDFKLSDTKIPIFHYKAKIGLEIQDVSPF